MEIVYRQGQVTANELMTELPGNPSNSTVRTLLRILEEKEQLVHEGRDGKYVYRPVQAQDSEGRNALGRVIDTFFKGSVTQTVAALLDERERLSADEIDELEKLIAKAKAEDK